MTTIGLIGAGHIGSQVARLAVANGYDVVISNSRGPETLSALVAELGPKARAATAAEAAKAGDIVVVTVPLKNYRSVPVEPLDGQDRHRHEQLLPATGRPHSRARQRIDHHVGAPAGPSPDLEGRQGLQPYLRRAAHHRRPAGRHEESPRAGDRGRRSRGQGHRHASARSVRLRHGGCGPAQGGVAHPARYARLRSAPHGGGAAQGPRRGEAVRRTAFRHAVNGRRRARACRAAVPLDG